MNGKINDFLNELETKGELIKEMECKLDKSNLIHSKIYPVRFRRFCIC